MFHYYMFVIVGPIFSFYYDHGLFILFILNLLLRLLAIFLSQTCSFFSNDFDWQLMDLMVKTFANCLKGKYSDS